MGGLILSCREACANCIGEPMQQSGSVFESCCRLGLSPLAQAHLDEALGLAAIRYVICGAFSSCCSCFGTPLW